jgi:isoleucyl-tRNA synthetase
MPFYAEELYQKVKSFAGSESVHLADWPESKKPSDSLEKIITDMEEVRKIVTFGLEARSKANIKVRQPLKSLKIKNQNAKFSEKDLENYKELIRDEINVKEVIVDNNLSEAVELDVNITPELKEEGNIRELLRAIQELRKTEKLNPSDAVILKVKTDQKGQNLIKKFEAEVKKTTMLRGISFEGIEGGTPVKVEDMDFELKISR